HCHTPCAFLRSSAGGYIFRDRGSHACPGKGADQGGTLAVDERAPDRWPAQARTGPRCRVPPRTATRAHARLSARARRLKSESTRIRRLGRRRTTTHWSYRGTLPVGG